MGLKLLDEFLELLLVQLLSAGCPHIAQNARISRFN